MPAAVAPSVRSTVGNTPSRAPKKPQTNLPTAPPAKTNVNATPISGTPAAFACNRNGRNVRNPIRVALSMTPIVNKSGKPLCNRPVMSWAWLRSDPLRTCAAANDTGRSNSKMAVAPKRPAMPMSDGAKRAARAVSLISFGDEARCYRMLGARSDPAENKRHYQDGDTGARSEEQVGNGGNRGTDREQPRSPYTLRESGGRNLQPSHHPGVYR